MMEKLPGPMPISQIAVVVRDIESALKNYHDVLGWGPWNVYEHKPPQLHHTELHGEAVDFTMLGAETTVSGIGFELLQPLDGPSIYKEWLDTHGEGLHHVACMMHSDEDADVTRRRFEAMGAQVMMGGRIGESIQFYYLDTQPSLKLIIESGSGHAIDLKPSWTYPPGRPAGI